MKYLITGGAGFIGSSLIHKICNDSNNFVLNIDKLTYASKLLPLNNFQNYKNYNFLKLDICDQNNLFELIKNFNPNVIINLAADSHVDRSIEGPYNFIKNNILGTYHLLEASLQYFRSLNIKEKSNFRFHHVSTDEVYGDLETQEKPFTEMTKYCPSSPYSASKASSDHLVNAWNRTFDLPTVISNCSNNYGPRQFPEKLIPLTIINAINGIQIPIYGNGKQIRDWLYVDDHVNALLMIAKNSQIGETYNVGGENEHSNINVVKKICSLLEDIYPYKPKNIKFYDDLIFFVKDRPGHDKRYAIDSSKLKKDLNWEAKENFESGLTKTIKWYIDNKDFLREFIKT